MADNPYAGLWDVSLDAEVLHREVQRHVDIALLEFASGLEIFSDDDTGDDIAITIFQGAEWCEGRVTEAARTTVHEHIAEYARVHFHEGDGMITARSATVLEPKLAKIEAMIAAIRTRYRHEGKSDV